ncbi:MAG TPA: UPF0175 family protein [Candidatus Nanoarchaeia archaeon]|nr:UPF0175 family protein [Candidatus Nanoarchaeia archaeon]
MAEVESFSLPTLMRDEISALVRGGYYSSKSDVAKDAFRCLLEHKPELKTTAAVELFTTGKISLGRAAEVAGVSTPEFKRILSDRKIVRKVSVSSTAGLKAAALIKSKR